MVVNGFDITPGANLNGAKLSYAKLRGADLTGAKMSYVKLRGANLISANLDSADPTGLDI